MNFPVKATLAAATLILVTACSGVEIKGVVRDKPTGNPISSATVSVGKESTATDAMGSYTLEVSDTDQAMIVNAPGYFLYTKTIGKDTINDIDLMPRE